MPKAKRQQVEERLSYRERKGHKWEEKHCKDGKNRKEDSAWRKGKRNAKKAQSWNTILRYTEASQVKEEAGVPLQWPGMSF